MTAVLDLKRPLRWLGPKDKGGHLWAQQDGNIFGWSESNVQYEYAWWLTPEGDPQPDYPNRAHIEALCKERPFKKEWLFFHQRVHYKGVLGLTACDGNWSHLPRGSLVTFTNDKSKVTCGNCRRTQGFFSRDDQPGDEVRQRVIR